MAKATFFIAFCLVPLILAVDPSELEALQDLYVETNGADWLIKDFWLDGDPCDDFWYGIVCDTDHVLEINLTMNNLEGIIPSTISGLFSLTLLNLDANLLEGEIPSEIGELPLQYLSLESNLLSGNLPVEFGFFTRIEQLYLDSNELSGPIPAEFGSLTTLVTLTMSRNDFAGNFPVIYNSLFLICIDLSNNTFSGTLPTEIGNLEELAVMKLNANDFEGSLPEELYNLSDALLYLDLSQNRFSGELSTQVGELDSLLFLRIEENSFSGTFPTEIANLALITLDITDAGFAGHLPRQIGSITSLKYFSAAENRFVGSIPTQLGLLTNCEDLILYSNLLSGEIPTHIGQLVSLTHLDLEENLLTGTIPTELGLLYNLEEMWLRENGLESELPTEFGNLQNLDSMLLSSNSLYGSIPTEIGNLSSITIINFFSNRLEGQIPTEIGLLDTLESLVLWKNDFSGSVPTEIGLLSSLVYLDLDSNRLSDNIPTEIGNLENLVSLFWSENSFSGQLPSQLSRLSNIQELYFDVNSLTGSIPSQLGRLSQLTTLNLRSNSMYGTLPTELGRVSTLKALYLGLNEFSGPIVELRFPKLDILDLQANFFSGPIPSFVCSVPYRNMNANFWQCPLPDCCSYEGDRTCVPCLPLSDAPIPSPSPWPSPSPSPTPSPTPVLDSPSPSPIPFPDGVIDSTWIEKRFFSVGKERVIYEIETTFEDEVNFIESVACPYDVYESVLDVPCDYSAEDCGEGETDIDTHCDEWDEYCTPDKKWTQLIDGEPDRVENLEGNSFEQYRFYNPNEIFAVEIRVVTYSGDPDLYLSYSSSITTTNFDVRENREGGDQIVLCPPDGLGTLFIAVFAYESPASFAVTANIITNLPQSPSPPIQIDRTETLFNGIPQTIFLRSDLGLTETEYSFSPARGTGCLVHVEVRGHTQLIVEPAQEETQYSATDVRYEGRSYLDLSFCPKDTNPDDFNERLQLKIFLINGDGENVILATTYAIFSFVPMSVLPAREVSWRLSYAGTAGLEITGDCDGCDGGVTTWSGNSGNAMNPPFAIEEALTPYILWNEESPIFTHTIFTYFLVPSQTLNLTVENQTTPEGTEYDYASIAPNVIFTVDRGLVQANGTQLTDPFNPSIHSSPQLVTCDFLAFNELAEEIVEFVEDTFPLSFDLEIRIVLDKFITLDAYRYNTTWSACERQLYQYFTSTSANVNQSVLTSTICEILPDVSICDESICQPEELDVTTHVTQLNQIDLELVEDTCLDPACTTLFLSDFGVDQNFLTSGECSQESDETIKKVEDSALVSSWYMTCKDKIFGELKRGRECWSNADCVLQSTCSSGHCTDFGSPCDDDDDCVLESECNFFEGFCTTTREESENLFLSCYINNMPIENQGYIATAYGILSDPGTPEYFAQMKDTFSSEDCVADFGSGLAGLDFRSHYALDVIGVPTGSAYECRCFDTVGSAYNECLDDLCVAPDACQFSVYDSYNNLLTSYDLSTKSLGCTTILSEKTADIETCEDEEICNWFSCETFKDCEDACEDPETSNGAYPLLTRDQSHFCSVCYDTLPCSEALSLDSSSDCNGGRTVCVTPFGAIVTEDSTPGDDDFDTEECEDEKGYCTGWCDYEEPRCVSFAVPSASACLAPDFGESDCVWWGGEFTNSLCSFPTLNDQEECEKFGFVFESCHLLSLDDCECYRLDPSCRKTTQNVLDCMVSNYSRCNKEDCHSPNGSCDDDILLNFNKADIFAGSCLLPFSEGEESLFCSTGSEVSQFGCIYHDLNAIECAIVGGNIVDKAFTQDQCEAHGFGCIVDETSVTGLLWDTSQEECEKCQGEGKYIPYFEWKEAQWVEGQIHEPEWIPREMVKAFSLESTLDFPTLASIVTRPTVNSLILSLESEAQCSTSTRVTNAMTIVTCSCPLFLFEGTWEDPVASFADSDSDSVDSDLDCDSFLTEVTSTARQTLCPQSEYTLIRSSTTLTFDESAINQETHYCLNLSAIFASTAEYTKPVSNPVSQSFVEERAISSIYEVVENNNTIIIGQLAGDGIELIAEFPEGVDVDQDDLFPVKIAQICFHSNASDIELLSTYSVFDIGMVSSDNVIKPYSYKRSVGFVQTGSSLTESVCFSDVDLYGGTTIMFPIWRKENYKDEDVFNTAEEAILYTTAILYSLGVLVVVFLSSGVPISFFRGPMLVNVAISIHCFILYVIRAVYFFLLVQLILPGNNEDVTDYILIEIPTFLYLGMFVLIVLSFTVAYLRGYKDKHLSENTYWIIFFGISILLWVTFIAVVLALNSLDTSIEETRDCAGRITEANDGDDSAKYIRIGYKSAIVLISLAVVVSLAFLNWMIQQRNSLFTQVLLASMGLLFNSIAFIIYYALGSSTPYFAIVLWFTELLPTCFMVTIVSPRRIFRADSQNWSAGHNRSTPETSSFSVR